MKKALLIISACLLLLTSCKKNSNEPEQNTPEVNPDQVKYPGKISSFDGYDVYYNNDGLLTSYSYHDPQSGNQKVTVTLNWSANIMTLNNTSLWGTTNAVYNRNIVGNCLESSQDIYNHWQYDSLNQLKTLNGVTYYWSNENIDSIRYSGQIEIYEYSSMLDTRDFGRKFIPALPMLQGYFCKNLLSKTIHLNSTRDTVNINHYTYLFNTSNRVIRETKTVYVNNTAQSITAVNFSYYE